MIDPEACLRNILAQLQQEPGRYKLFGVYWWAIKAMLRRQYDQHNLYLLGPYMDMDCVARMPHEGVQATLAAALETYQFNACYPHPDGLAEDPNGELVAIFDADAGL